ncbi:C39 family peptidase [Floccifex sp.]|uniref:C39 family peptidase n=1 Tax=Floccifex sp. TaxID=2815810 RepID=UPI003F10BF9E
MKNYYLNEVDAQGNEFYDYDVYSIEFDKTNKESKLIKLPLYRQSHNFTCGVSCVSSVLRYSGYDFDTREDRLFLQLKATPENGTNYENIANYLDSVRMEGNLDKQVIKTEIINEEYNSNIDDLLIKLRTSLDNDSPVICAIQAWKDDANYESKSEDDGHYVVLIGYQKNEINNYIYYFMDSSTSGSYTYLTEEEFILRWHDNVEGQSKRIGIIVSYLDSIQEVPIDVIYHID